MPIGSFFRHFSSIHLSDATGRHFDIRMNFINRLGMLIVGIPHTWLRLRIRLVLSLMNSTNRSTRILNAGCGYGILDIELAIRGFTNLTLIDLAQERIDKIEHQKKEYPLLEKRITTQVGSVTELPFADNAFDVVISSEVIEHVQNDAKMMRELGRVVTHSGKVIITTPADSKSNAKDYHIYGHTKPGYSVEELESLGKQAGLSLTECHYYMYSLGRKAVLIHDMINSKPLIALLFYPLYLLTLIGDWLRLGEPNGIIIVFKK